jgi:hypothetical protein
MITDHGVCDSKRWRKRQRLFLPRITRISRIRYGNGYDNGICYGFSRMVMSSGLMAWKGDTAFWTEANLVVAPYQSLSVAYPPFAVALP